MNHPTSRTANKPLVLLSLLLAAFAINLDTTIVNVALPSLVRELHATDTQLQWIVDAYNLVFAAFILAAGSLSDKIGRKGLLLSGLAVFGLSSLAGAAATNANQLIAARAVMGLGAAMVFPATLSLISNVFTERNERARAIGLWGATAGMAIALGPIFGGWLLARYSWASIFVAMAPVALAGIVLVARFVPTSREAHAAPLDRPGIGYSTLAMSLLVFTIIEAPTYGWLAPRSLAGFALAALLLGAFLIREGRTRYPMLDMHLFRNRRFSAACAAVTVAFFTLFGFIFLMTQYFQFVKGYSAPFGRCAPAAGRDLGRRFIGARNASGGPLRVQARGHERPGDDHGVLPVGRAVGDAHAPLRRDRRADGALRHRHGPDQRSGDGVDHGRRAARARRRRLGRQRRDAPVGRHARRRGDRQRFRLDLRGPPDLADPHERSRSGPRRRQGVGRRGVRCCPGARASGHAALGGVIHQAAQTAFIHGLSIGCLVAAIVGAQER